MKKIPAAAVLAALALLLGGCGGGSNDEQTQDEAASQAISDSIMKEQKSNDSASQFFTMKQKDADCIGEGLVDQIGTDQLQTYGLLTKDNKAKDTVTDVKMSPADAKSATDVLFDCTDVATMMQKAMAQSGDIPDQMKVCINKVLTEDTLRGMFTKIFSGQQEQAQKALVQPLTKCALGNAG